MEFFIFTRFNLLMAGDSIYTRMSAEEADQWMEHRIYLFEKYTLPSILNQTDKDFTWLLSFDERTPYDIIRRYDYLDNVQVIFEYPKDYLKFKVSDEWIITSRLDNDDYLYPDYVKRIKSEFREQEEIIDIDYLQFDHFSGKYYTSERSTPNSPFLALAEFVDKISKTCFYCSHTKMPQNFPARKIDEILALMIIHDWNVSNKIVGREVVWTRKL